MKPIHLCVGTTLFCLGCDGVYSYTYEGTVHRPDKLTPAQNIPIGITPREPGSNIPAAAFDIRSDRQRHFSGSFTILTSWVLFLRPPAPKLQRVYMLTPSIGPIEIPLSDAQQQETNAGRHIMLPTVTLPANP